MSQFSDVDHSPSVARLVSYLEGTDQSMSALKAYIAAAFARDVAGGTILDVGCGLGRDLDRLEAHGLRAVGIDLSASMLRHCGHRSLIAQADAAALPFRDNTFHGCRVERTLQHVADVERCLDEIVRVLRPGGVLINLDPDYSRFRVESDVVPRGTWPAALLMVRHPNVGTDIVPLLEARGLRIRDFVIETSYGFTLDHLPVDADSVVGLAVEQGRCDNWLARAWLDEQRARSAAGTFRAQWDKAIVVATKAQ